jgi:hypothetical protein
MLFQPEPRKVDNRKLAKAVAVLYRLAADPEQGEVWADTDEALQDAAFVIYQQSTSHYLTFARRLIDEGVSVNLAAQFCDVPSHEVRRLELYASCHGLV